MPRRSSIRKLFQQSVRLCPAMKRCDGVVLPPGREVCRPCEDAIAGPKVKALKGERVIEYQRVYRSERKKKARMAAKEKKA